MKSGDPGLSGSVPVLIAAAYVLFAATTFGCGSEPPVHSGGPLVSEGSRIAFARATEFAAPDFESEVYAINVETARASRV